MTHFTDAAFTIVKAEKLDFDAIKHLNDNAFATGSLIFEPADSEELKAGIDANRTFVLRVGDVVAGFYQYDILADSHVELVSIVVDGEARSSLTQKGRGYGKALLIHFLALASTEVERLGSKATISVVTSIENLRMISMLLKHGFIVLRVIPGYFGPGKDRVYCEHQSTVKEPISQNIHIVPAVAKDYIATLLNGERYVSQVIRGAQGVFFEIKRFGA